ncbi:MAG TPA: helix-hairpin-helix domain-containing protein [Caldilineaceae bacterium]|nr:helix-hairpin-helix domain-containing protein [Caldilineaceae bacterium]
MASAATGLLRPRYFDRQQLSAADLTLGIDYIRQRLRRHNRYLHGWGAVCGAVVSATANPWQVQVGEGYVVTPEGDEVYIPAAALPYDIQQEATACLDLELPCAEPENLDDQRVVKIMRGNLDPLGKDLNRDYNREWLQLKVLRQANLRGVVVQHTINPGTANAALFPYYTFGEETIFPAGTIIRIHSGAAADDPNPDPRFVHRYVADPGERGNWRLNNPFDTVRVLDAAGNELDRRTLEQKLVYLAVYADETPSCPQPRLPERCQPAGGDYQFSRTREGVRFAILCELPPSHRDAPSCATLEGIVCRNEIAPCPPPLAVNDNGVVLAAIAVSDEGIIETDNTSVRRQLVSESLLQAYLRCQCEEIVAPGRITSITPAQVTVGSSALTVNATITGEGLAGATQVLFAGSGIQAQVVGNNDPNQLSVVLTIAANTQPGQYAFFVIFPDSRPALSSANFNVLLTLVTATQPTIFTQFTSFTQLTIFTQFTSFTQPTLFTQVTIFTQPTIFTQFTSFTQPTFFTLPTIPVITAGPVFELDPTIFDLERGRNQPVTQLAGIGQARGQRLSDAGITNLVDLASAPVERLTEVLDISAVRAAALQDEARNRIRRT